jgi:hypothetical protein
MDGRPAADRSRIHLTICRCLSILLNAGKIPLLELARLNHALRIDVTLFLKLIFPSSRSVHEVMSIVDHRGDSVLHALFTSGIGPNNIGSAMFAEGVVESLLGRQDLLRRIDLSQVNRAGQDLMQLFEAIIDESHLRFMVGRHFQAPSEAQMQQEIRRMQRPARLRYAWQTAILPTCQAELDCHLIPDLASIVCEVSRG